MHPIGLKATLDCDTYILRYTTLFFEGGAEEIDHIEQKLKTQGGIDLLRARIHEGSTSLVRSGMDETLELVALFVGVIETGVVSPTLSKRAGA